jgi:taurine dioxygenase
MNWEGSWHGSSASLGERIGLEVSDVDVDTVNESDFAAIYGAWLDRNVMVIPGRTLDIEAFLRYSRRFGIAASHDHRSPSGLPEIMMLDANK